MFKTGVEGQAIITFGGGVGLGITRQHIIKAPHVVVDFCTMKKGTIGKYYKPSIEEIIKPTPVKFVFEKVESIDAVITMLQQAKERLKMEIDTYEEGEE